MRNDILFGYNSSDLLTAEEVLKDGYGQCNTKATLLMALFRGVEKILMYKMMLLLQTMVYMIIQILFLKNTTKYGVD